MLRKKLSSLFSIQILLTSIGIAIPEEVIFGCGVIDQLMVMRMGQSNEVGQAFLYDMFGILQRDEDVCLKQKAHLEEWPLGSGGGWLRSW